MVNSTFTGKEPSASGSRPTALKPRFESIPHELRTLPNWVMWRYEPPKKPNGKWPKVPYQPNGYRADTTKPSTWSSFETCRTAYEMGGYDGVGFVFDGEVGPDGTCLVGIDLDHCVDTSRSKVFTFAVERIKRLDTYTEASPSGTGLHMIGRTEPVGNIKTREVEVYVAARYFTFTGRKWDEESPIRIATAEVRALIAELRAKQTAPSQLTAAPSSVIKTAPAFAHLPIRNVAEGISTNYWFDLLTPEQKDEVVDHALGVIASKTPLLEVEEDGGNNDQWYRLTTAVARSGAPNAEDIFVKHASAAKNADPEDALREYFARCQKDHSRGRGITVGTLLGLASEQGADFEPWRRLQHDSPEARERRAKQIAENIEIGEDVTEPLLPQIMTLEEMQKRLVFVGSRGVVADIITGRVRKKEHAVDEYAASQHSYTLQGGTLKKGPALKFWIASKDRMTVEVLAWVPGAPQICPPPEGPGPAFNMWRGLSPMAFPEDWQERATPFLEHVEFLVPIAQERERFLQWLAHIVRHPEVLPHTSYLMITPVMGVGRNLLASILVRALRGFVAAGVSLPELLDKGFTGRLSQKLLVTVDEAREGRGERRYERAERFKQLQTEEHRHVNHKYGHQIVEKNCGRWLMFSNHDDAIPFDPADRRVIVIANPTVRKKDAYYERLYGLLNDKDFIGSVRHWLETKDITGFRPGEHAPTNQAKLQVLNEMMSETERAVAEFKEDCKTELTTRDAIRDHVSGVITRNGNKFANVNDMHLTHAIRRAGMTNTGRRIMAYTTDRAALRASETRLSVVIVRGEWTIEIIKRADPGKLLEAMGIWDWTAAKPQR